MLILVQCLLDKDSLLFYYEELQPEYLCHGNTDLS